VSGFAAQGVIERVLRNGLTLLKIPRDMWDALEETKKGISTFSVAFPHLDLRRVRTPSTALVAAGEGKKASMHLGLLTSVAAVTTLQSRARLDRVSPIVPATVRETAEAFGTKRMRNLFLGLVSAEAACRAVSRGLAKTYLELLNSREGNKFILEVIADRLAFPKLITNARVMQRDAVWLALKAFGVTRDLEPKELFLAKAETALNTLRCAEDAAIEHDARWIEGWKLTKSDVTGRAVFEKEGEKLEVITANKRPLEELFGVDLIYLNEPLGSIAMVQYKMMEPLDSSENENDEEDDEEHEGEREWVVPIDRQFLDELERMAKFADRRGGDRAPYRLNDGVFFLKLLKRNAKANSAGVILSLDHFNVLRNDGKLKGPRGGMRLAYSYLNGHYLRNDALVELIRSGYVGSRGSTTRDLQTLVEATLRGGRALVAAIRSRSKS